MEHRPATSSHGTGIETSHAGSNGHENVSLDCDSEELDALEDAAEAESVDDEEIDLLIEQSALVYPEDRIDSLVKELKEHGLVSFMQKNVVGQSKHNLQALLVGLGILLPAELRKNHDVPIAVYVDILKTVLVRHLRTREKLHEFNTVDDAVELLRKSRQIIVLGGAGISTSCGIPDFRSEDGIYARLQREGKYPSLTEPSDMFDKDFFMHDPSCFFSFAGDIFPSNFKPSPSHRFIKLLEEKGKLLRNYTQNIDTLEDAAGIEKVLHCHGSFSRAKCTTADCGYEVPGAAIKEDVMAKRVAYCPRCKERGQAKHAVRAAKEKKRRTNSWHDNDSDDSEDADPLPGLGVLKPCITFFGESLSNEFDQCLLADRDKVDLLIIIGTTLKVAPVSEIVAHLPHTTPILFINRTPVLHFNLDIQLLGNADTIIEYLCNRLDWSLPAPQPAPSVVGESSAAEQQRLQDGTQNGHTTAPTVPATPTPPNRLEPRRLHERYGRRGIR